MEGSISGSATTAVHNLTDAAAAFVDEAQSFANAGVDLGQEGASMIVHTALDAVEKTLAAVKALVAGL